MPLTGPDGQPMLLEDIFTDRRAATLAEAVRAATTSPMSCW
ncbi:4-alpha-glucanotransferase malQ [Mycobacterium tuberculosis]|nr:4-alpha-glucanotransferase malQ [Mycobacterium tuberculosis]CPA03275.1 4-alpha-glucanotransferase malQ [Mycobacterium tuberculosis]